MPVTSTPSTEEPPRRLNGRGLQRSIVAIGVVPSFAVLAAAGLVLEHDAAALSTLLGLSLVVVLVVAFVANRAGRAFDTEMRRLSEELAAKAQAQAELVESSEQALESSRLKSEFLANMSHEIRTPMNGVLGMLSVLSTQPLGEDVREIVDTIHVSANSLLAIINDILDFSKIEAGKLTVEDVEMDPEAIIDDVLELASAHADAKGIDLLAVLGTSVPRAIRGDPTRFRQVVTNLVANAIKFTSDGEVTVHIEVQSEHLMVCIQDTGVGVPFEAQKYIFEAFRQADGSTTRRHGGTGLGLSIARQLVELMGGRIGLTSAIDVGSSFWFEIPFVAGETAPAPPCEARVLVVGERAPMRDALVRRLGTYGARVESAASMNAGIAKLDDTYDLIIADLRSALPVDPLVAAAARVGARLAIATSTPTARRHGSAPYETLTRPWRGSRLRELLKRTTTSRMAPVVPRSRPSMDAGAGPLRAGLRVLVVDDNAVNLKVAQRMLGRLGCVVAVRSSGEDALSALEQQSFDAVLMDCQMPGLDGYETTRRLRKLDGAAARTTVIAATANAMRGDREKCLDAGMDDYVSKPLAMDELARALSAPRLPMARRGSLV